MNTLNVYSLMQHPLRSTAQDHLYSFRRHGSGNQLYLNLAVREVPGWVREAPIDAVVYHTTFFSWRWEAARFLEQVEAAAPLKGVGRIRVALPQDEYTETDAVNRFIEEFEIDHVFSLAKASELAKIYDGVDRKRVGFTTDMLPGYLSDDTRQRIDRIVAGNGERPIDIGYRAWPGAPWLGRHSLLKGEVGEAAAEAAPGLGLKTDISSDNSDVLTGDDWFRFLASCKYTLGCEGGASMLDPDGAIRRRTDRYTTEHPGASFDDVEAACFPGLDGNLDYFAIGPRHIEACATRTCQILVEGEYQGVLRPGEHYIALEPDLSNLAEVLELVKRDELRAEITERAYRDVIASGQYGYDSLVGTVESVTVPAAAPQPERRAAMALRSASDRAADALSWARVIWRVRLRWHWQRLVQPFDLIRYPRHTLRAVRRRLSGRANHT